MQSVKDVIVFSDCRGMVFPMVAVKADRPGCQSCCLVPKLRSACTRLFAQTHGDACFEALSYTRVAPAQLFLCDARKRRKQIVSACFEITLIRDEKALLRR
jgi:hypothetical protein